jgi:pilus assembly protein Flp/PilA
MKMLMIRLLTREDGQDLIEYGLLVGIITLASVLAVVSIGAKVNTYFTNVNTLMP